MRTLKEEENIHHQPKEGRRTTKKASMIANNGMQWRGLADQCSKTGRTRPRTTFKTLILNYNLENFINTDTFVYICDIFCAIF